MAKSSASLASSTSLVVDASVALGWVIEDQADAFTDSLLAALSTRSFWVPVLWTLETVNALAALERRKRLQPERRRALVQALSELPLRVDHQPVALTTLDRIAHEYKLTAYDAAYLELAIRRELPLATRDAALVRAARAARVPVETAG